MEQRNENPGLHERRRRKDGDAPVNFSQIRRPTRPFVHTGLHSKAITSTAQMTPPETPLSPQDTQQTQIDQPSVFHNYLRAFHPFDQTTSFDGKDESVLVTASIQSGDLILVHSVHANGWADGTVLTSGARGWLPTNYCENFDHPYMRNLLNAMTQFWDLLGGSEEANLSTFVRQDYIRGLIAGVRYLLEHADCLHRDAAPVLRHTGIRRMRKGLLADLSTLVKIAKRLQNTISEPSAGEAIHVLLDDLMAKAFRVVTRAVGFLDMWTKEIVDKRQSGPKPTLQVPDTPPVDSDEPAVDTMALLRKEVSIAIDSAKHFGSDTTAEDIVADRAEEAHRDSLHRKRASTVFRPQSGMVAHRVSLIKTEHKKGSNLGSNLASEQLAWAHDACISHIGAFIGLHLHSRPSAELVATTDRLVKACQDLLAIVDQIYAHDSQCTSSVQEARTNFQSKLEELTQSTKAAFRFSDGPDDEVLMMPDQSSHLVDVGTSLIRTVGECVAKSRTLIEQIGDFDLEHPLRERAQSSPDTPAPDTDTTEQEANADTSKDLTQDEKRISKMFPPPPPVRDNAMTATDVADFAISPAETLSTTGLVTPLLLGSPKSFSAAPLRRRSTLRMSETAVQDEDALKGPELTTTKSNSPERKASFGASIAGSTDTYQSNVRDSGITTVSEGSTRATTPDHVKESSSLGPTPINSFASLSSLRSAANTEASNDVETQLLQKTYASELTLNKEGQVTGGTLPALVEQLTTHDSAPDPQFVTAFFITFRTFTTPRELAQALTSRFEYIGDSRQIGTPVRLRVYNVFKGWLETYWIAEADKDALGDIRYFALHKLKPHLPSAGERLIELMRKITAGYQTGNTHGPLVSGVGKISTSLGTKIEEEGTAPEPVVTKHQLAALRSTAAGGAMCNIIDFDPLEVARQLTLAASKIFAEIRPDELLSLDWNKKDTVKARNVRNMCVLNTDLAHVVGDTILAPDDAKKRALIIKHWAKVAGQCLELNNYESLMAIMCSLNSSVVRRLKRTWEVVSKKTKARMEELNAVVDFSRNQASLRKRLENPVAPCLPFLGVYLTDLTFVDAGNPKLRELPGTASDSGETISVINFDKYMRMARIIAHVQKFQVPYNLQPVPEMQAWMEMYLQRMHEGHAELVGKFHRRSLIIEPKQDCTRPRMPDVRRTSDAAHLADERPKTPASTREGAKFEFFLKSNLAFKMARHDLPISEAHEHAQDQK